MKVKTIKTEDYFFSSINELKLINKDKYIKSKNKLTGLENGKLRFRSTKKTKNDKLISMGT